MKDEEYIYIYFLIRKMIKWRYTFQSYNLRYVICDLSKGMDHVPRIYVSMGITNTDKCAQNIGIHGVFGVQHVS